MRRRVVSIVLIAWLAGVFAPRATAAPQTISISLDDYAARLEAIAAAIETLDERQPREGRRVVGSIPAAWIVSAEGQTWTVPAQWMARGLVDWQRQPTRAGRDELVAQIRAARASALAFAAPVPDRTAARAALDRVLSAREFRGVRGPSWWNGLMQRVLRRLLAWLQLIVGSSSLPAITNLFVYALIGVAVIALAFWARGALRASARFDVVEAPDDLRTLPKRPWTEWLSEAQRSATEQDWREAIRFAYWCGIVFLESKELWTADGSRTPREYIRLLPAGDAHTAPLRSLTGVLERVWYGAAPADAERYAETLALLRSLGCPA